MKASFIHHVTLSTGHVARTPRADVSEEAIRACAEMLMRALEHGDAVPIECAPTGHVIFVTTRGRRCANVAVHFEGEPLVHFGVAVHSRCGGAMWVQLIETQMACSARIRPYVRCPPEPWCGVVLYPAFAKQHGLATWLDDFERCVAWAWVDICDGRWR